MDLRYKKTTLTTPEDHRWLGNDYRSSTEGTDTIQLDGASLVAIFTDGLVKSGTVLAQDATTKRYYPYDPAGTNGKGVAKGFLYTSIYIDPTSPFNSPAALVWKGQVKEELLPRTSGQVGGADATAKTALKLVRFA